MFLTQSSNDIYSSNDMYKKSFYSKSKRPSIDDEHYLKSEISANIPLKTKRRSASPPLSVASVDEMNQQTIKSHPDESSIGVPSRFCSVCGDISTGIHFGGNSCESCKAFFRRSVQCNRYQNYKCSNDEHCPVNLVTRKVCQFCRYTKCTTVGMKPKWVLSDQEREEKYGSRRKRCRPNPTSEEDPEIYKYLTKEEKSLIEDIAQALYQSRATYPLQFPSQLNSYLKLLATGNAPAEPPASSASTTEKQPNSSANFLIVPIRRSVLFARMLKDFEIFSEDDKVNLLKGSAIESIVWSSNTLFDPKTHTFTNYVSRDQRAVMDEQIIALDPLLKRLWGEDLFNRTTQFLVSMCDLQIDEVTSTLLVPVLLFSPDRPNIKDTDAVKRLQIKYVTILRKYMLWRYGKEKTETVYPKLLLQIINIRTLSLAHAEIIQKVMATSTVDPLVKEVTNKPEPIDPPPPSSITTAVSINSVSSSNDNSIKTPLSDTESNMGSDEDETSRKKSRPSVDEDEELDETNIRNIWRKRRKCSIVSQTEQLTNSLSISTFNPHENIKQEPESNSTQRKPYDHQVPSFIPTCPDDLSTNSNRISSFRHLPPKKQSFFANRDELHSQHSVSSSSNDMSPYDHYLRSNSATNSPLSKPLYDNYHQTYSPMPSPTTYSQQQNEQHLFNLSLANKQCANPSSNLPKSHSLTSLKPDEQQLLDAIHAHPNKRDLVLNLLRQMNDSSTLSGDFNSFRQ